MEPAQGRVVRGCKPDESPTTLSPLFSLAWSVASCVVLTRSGHGRDAAPRRFRVVGGASSRRLLSKNGMRLKGVQHATSRHDGARGTFLRLGLGRLLRCAR